MARAVAVVDPTGRVADAMAAAVASLRLEVQTLSSLGELNTCEADAVLLPMGYGLDELPHVAGPPRWVVGDAADAGKLAGAAARAGAIGVLLTPITAASLAAVLGAPVTAADVDIARARTLMATSMVDLGAHGGLQAVVEAFAATDGVAWWRDGQAMIPHGAREEPCPGYYAAISAAARIAAAASSTVIISQPLAAAVIAEPLRAGPNEIAGMFAVVTEPPRPMTVGERKDLKALSARIGRELSWVAGHRRLIAEGERLLATSLHDALTGTMTRGAFEQTVTTEIASARRRQEPCTLVVLNLIGLRAINTEHGHKAGDLVLSHVAQQIRATVRTNDPIGRITGASFAILLLAAPPEQAVMVAEKLIKRVMGAPAEIGGAPIRVLARAATASIHADERSGAGAIARAHAAVTVASPTSVARVDAESANAQADSLEGAGLTAGTIVGGSYRVLHELSRGAMGVVYRGEDLGLGRPVAIKVLRSDLASDHDLVSGFRAEASLLAALHHNNLVQVYALGEHAGDVYFVMELVEGQSLREVADAHYTRGEWLPAAAVAQIILELGDALDAMHAIGVIHRDVKPANVLLDRNRDRAVLVDVGIAAKSGNEVGSGGTPGFAAPESFVGGTQSHSADVYGLAATAYAVLTGTAPWGKGNLAQLVHRQLNDRVIPPSLHRPALGDAVDTIIIKALSPAPDQRWSSASAFAIALARALQRAGADLAKPSVSASGDAITMAIDDPAAALPAATPREPRPSAAPVTPPRPRSTRERVSLAPPSRPSRPDATPPDPLAATMLPTPLPLRQVRSAHFRVAWNVLTLRLGDHAVRSILAAHPALASLVSSTASPLAWVGLDQLVTLCDAVEEHAPGREFARMIGRGTMTATFTRLLGADPTALNPRAVLRAGASFWRRYHDWSTYAATVQDDRAEVLLEGIPGSLRICELVGGELQRIVELTGGGQVRHDHPACVLRGAAACTHVLRWVNPPERA